MDGMAVRLRFSRLLGVTLWLLLPAAPAAAADYYYLVVFGAQRNPFEPRFTHSFAVFARASGCGPNTAAYRLETFTISWLPQTLELHPVRALPEPGVNLDLYRTLQWTCQNELRVSAWGPFLIQKDLYDRARQQQALLQSGTVDYKMVDTGYHSDCASNCIHAVSSIAGGHRLRVLSPAWGETASYYIVQRFRPWIVGPCQTHDWVYARMGLPAYPIVRRPADEPPRTGPLWSAAKLALGGP